jgi:hypothetical protein
MATETKSLRAAMFKPTTSLSGNEPPSVFRGMNLVLRGAASGNPYFEVFPGNKDLNENFDLTLFAITGTIAFDAGDVVVRGAGSLFKTELHLRQHILIGTQVLQVESITSDTRFVCSRAPDTSESSLTGYRLPQIFEVDGKRGVMATGSAIKVGKGHYIVVGSGTFYMNGMPLPGMSLTASNRAKAAIYRPTTDDYIVEDLGFDDSPPVPTVEVVAGGTKGMVDGNKASFVFSYWTGSPEGTDGYSNPSDVVKLDNAGNPIAIAGTNNQFEFDFTTSLVGLPSNAKGFIAWCSQQGKEVQTISGATVSVTSPNEGNYNNGPWFKYIHPIALSDLDGANKFKFDYLDKELYSEVTDDNFRPPAAEYVCKIEGKPAYVSCFGPRTATDDDGTSPGNAVVISKEENPDGVPFEWAAYTSSTIIGWFEGVGRWFIMTAEMLWFLVSTGLYGQNSQGGAEVQLPIISRPYWKTGASNRYSIILVDDTLFGRSGGRFFKSVGSGDENVKKYDFGSVMDDITRDIVDGYVIAGNDPLNTQIAFIHSAAYKNSSGYWVSEIFPYSLFNDAWLPKIVLTSTTRDMIVSGAATVNEKLEFLCGGRVSGGTYQMRTYRYGAGDDTLTEMDYYLIWQISDDGAENMSKRIHSIRPQGLFHNVSVQVHGAKPGGEISVEDMENGTNAIASVTFGDVDEVTRYLERKVKISNLSNYTLRLAGRWEGTQPKDRLEELVVEISTHGRER